MKNSQWFCILVCNFFTAKHYRSRCRSECRSRWKNLDRGHYRFQPIKFVNLVVPSPCETEPYIIKMNINAIAVEPLHDGHLGDRVRKRLSRGTCSRNGEVCVKYGTCVLGVGDIQHVYMYLKNVACSIQTPDKLKQIYQWNSNRDQRCAVRIKLRVLSEW